MTIKGELGPVSSRRLSRLESNRKGRSAYHSFLPKHWQQASCGRVWSPFRTSSFVQRGNYRRAAFDFEDFPRRPFGPRVRLQRLVVSCDSLPTRSILCTGVRICDCPRRRLQATIKERKEKKRWKGSSQS